MHKKTKIFSKYHFDMTIMMELSESYHLEWDLFISAYLLTPDSDSLLPSNLHGENRVDKPYQNNHDFSSEYNFMPQF